MKSSALTAFGVFAYQSGPNANVRPCLVLDTKPWMMGTRKVSFDGSTEKTMFSIATSTRFARSAKYPLPEGMTCGLPVLITKHSTYRWLTEKDEERIADTAEHILLKAAERLDVENLIQDYEADEPPLRLAQVTVQLANGRSAQVDVTLELVRPQSVLGPWAVLLEEKRREHDQELAKSAQRQAQQSGSDLLDRDLADRLDALLGAKARSPYTGLRPDVVRHRGGTEFQVSVQTMLELVGALEEARK